MGTAALLASLTAALYFLATGVKKPRKKGEDKKPAESEKRVEPEQSVARQG